MNGVQSNKLRLFPGASRQDTAQTCTSDLSPARDPRIRSVERGPLLPAGRSPAVKVSSYLFKNKSAVFTIRPVPSLFFIRKSSRQRLSMAGWVWWTRRHMQTVCVLRATPRDEVSIGQSVLRRKNGTSARGFNLIANVNCSYSLCWAFFV